jgi:hypothetical protein
MSGVDVLVSFSLPGIVWGDALDPDASTMQAELGLPEPERRKIGRGAQYRYELVPLEVARELRLHLLDLADCRGGQEGDEYGNRLARELRAAAERIPT